MRPIADQETEVARNSWGRRGARSRAWRAVGSLGVGNQHLVDLAEPDFNRRQMDSIRGQERPTRSGRRASLSPARPSPKTARPSLTTPADSPPRPPSCRCAPPPPSQRESRPRLPLPWCVRPADAPAAARGATQPRRHGPAHPSGERGHGRDRTIPERACKEGQFGLLHSQFIFVFFLLFSIKC